MDTHVKVLGVLYLTVSALTLLAALVLILAFGGIAAIVGIAADPADAAVSIPVLGVIGTAVVSFLLIISVPGLVVGWGLLTFRPWARILGLVLSALNLLNIPFGTALGIYGLWVLLHRDAEPLFAGRISLPIP